LLRSKPARRDARRVFALRKAQADNANSVIASAATLKVCSSFIEIHQVAINGRQPEHPA
jgi:hypothetical protein